MIVSNNVISAENQQERLYQAGWIVGFVDGEGCFSVSIFHNAKTKFGWQIMPEFVVTQGEKSLSVLQEMQTYFKCGKIFVNRRYDNHHEHLYRFCVRKLSDLSMIIIPFFQRFHLQTAKQRDFDKFCTVVSLLQKKEHAAFSGIQAIAKFVGKDLKENPQRLHANQL